MTGPAALRVAVVGPTHPYKGGVAAHTTTLAHELAEAGHDVTLVSWSHLYPSRLYPGEQAVPGGAPDVPPFPRTVRALSWARPDTWVRTGRRLRGFDAIVVVHVIPAVVPAHLVLLRAARGGSGDGPRVVAIVHNVLPHETHPGDRALVRRFFDRVDAVLVHSTAQARLAHDLGAGRVSVAELPPHLPGGAPAERPPYDGPTRLLALGIVREYKGVDLLMRALARVPGPTLTVAGEMWGEAGERVKALAQDPRLRDRVEVHSGYVPADRLAPLLASHDVLALTYRTATASQNVLLGLSHGLPVLASDVGTFGAQVRDGVDGVLVPPDDEESLVAALQRLAEPSYAARLRSAVDAPDLSGPWATYVGTLEALASADAGAEDAGPGRGRRARRGAAGVRARSAPSRAASSPGRARPSPPAAPPSSSTRATCPTGSAPPTSWPTPPTPTTRGPSPGASACPGAPTASPPGPPSGRWPRSCGCATTAGAAPSSSTSRGAARPSRDGRGPSASPRSSSTSPAPARRSRCSTSTPPRSTSSPGCTRTAATPTTSTRR